MRETLTLTRKELNSYFSSIIALIFVGGFLAVTLFTFFWVEDFWARGIADVRPLFTWLPVLMIFLAAALTMRQWSDEQQTGTLEMLLILPVRLWQLVLGKFLAAMTLVAVSLALTLFVPISIASLGDLDLGPVIGGYLAALLMAAAYIAIGLFLSSLTGNALVSLFLTVATCGLLHLVGSPQITELADTNTADILRAVGSGSRFQSIERGVIDLRDLIYYSSLAGVFLVLNVLALDMKRWGRGNSTKDYRFNTKVAAGLLAANLLAVNIILFPLASFRADLTENGEYSLSDVTKELLQDLDEPLSVTFYISEENHPLLEPLIPQVRDLLEEYRIAADGNLELEIIDPADDSEKETEANQTYGIRPSPVTFQDRSGSSVLNIYFDILIRYGDENTTLNFGDLIEVEQFGTDVEVRLRNLEYDLTRSIKRVVSGFQSIDAVLATLDEPAMLTLYTTPASLPEDLQDASEIIETVANNLNSGGKFNYQLVDVDDPNDSIDGQYLFDTYNIRPFSTDFFGGDLYYLHMTLQVGDQVAVIFPSGGISEAEITTNIESALQRLSSGFLTVVGVWTPPQTPQFDQFGQQLPNLQTYNSVLETLRADYEVRTVNLATGTVPSDIDVLIVVAPENLTDKDVYAVDQFLMRGGAVIIAAGNYKLSVDQFSGNFSITPMADTLAEMLTSYGITIENQLILDSQNEPFPIPIDQFTIEALDYPFFIDVRPDGMNRDNVIVSTLPAITISWASPITINDDLIGGRDVEWLLRSTDESWARTSTNIQPDANGNFPIDGEQKRYTLAVAMRGSFESFFKDKPNPFATESASDPNERPQDETETEDEEPPPPFIETSPNNARLVVVGSSEFLNDLVFQISQTFRGQNYVNNLQFVQNSIDWATEDPDLLTIRSSGTQVRLLDPIDEDEQQEWEIGNYAVALIGVAGIGVMWRLRKRAEQPIPLVGYGDDNDDDDDEDDDE